jgi:hypothetical protein
MHRSSVRPIRLAVALAAGAALALTACGDDDSSGGDVDTFCEEITTLAESEDSGDDATNLAMLQSVADAAPSEISDEFDELVDAFEQLQSFDAEAATDEEMAEFLDIADGLDEASARIEEFAVENCPDLPAGLFTTGE